MRFWWHTNPGRVASERRAVETLSHEEPWFHFNRWLLHDARLYAAGVITAHEHSYPIRLVYPDQFPLVPAWVEPQEGVDWSTHQYGTGTLCLEHRPDNWTVDTTGADLLRSAHHLFITEDTLGIGGERAPSAHHVGDVQAYTWSARPVLIGTQCLERIRRGQSVDLKTITWGISDEVFPVLVQDAEDRQSIHRPTEADILAFQLGGTAFTSISEAPTGTPDRAALIAAGQFEPAVAGLIGESTNGVVVFAGNDRVEAFQFLNEGAVARGKVFVLPDETGERSGREPGVESKRVAIVGAGSVGSKIAENLLRSGVTRLTLNDGDVMLPDNIERHVLDWRDVGVRKVHALKRRLLRIVPGADIEVFAENLNWQRSAKSHALQIAAIARSDVIVDATGDPASSLLLGAIADENGRAFVSVEVFEGGIGALIATALPERDPPFAVGRAGFLAWCESEGTAPPESAPRTYEALAEDGTIMVADDAAVTTTAGHASRVVLDILDGRPAPISAAWLLLGYREGWVFEGHGHTIRLDVGARAAPEAETDDPETRSFIRQRLLEIRGESDAGD